MQFEKREQELEASIPACYAKYLAPLMLDAFGEKMAKTVMLFKPKKVLEISAGTGVTSRALLQYAEQDMALVATELSQGMLSLAQQGLAGSSVRWLQADAQALPFEDNSFDLVMCQFGVMFFADKVKAYREVARVLKPGGQFIFTVWDSLAHNELAKIVTQALAFLFPNNPPSFLARGPYAYFNQDKILLELEQAGFHGNTEFLLEQLSTYSESADDIAMAFCQGTPLKREIEKLASVSLSQATEYVGKSIEKKLGTGAIRSQIQAYLVCAILTKDK